MANNNNEDVVRVLNQQVANWTVAFTKLHNFHWYVKGPNFFALHTKFEELYDEASQFIDDLAERILAIGGNPVGTLKESLDIAELSKGFTNVSKQLEEAIEVAGKAEDDVTEDMFIGMQTDIDKHNWMLKSYLGE